MIQLTGTFGGNARQPDRLRWRLDNKGNFSVTSYWFMNHNSSMNRVWPLKLIWRTKIPVKVSCFVWLVARRACLTRQNLQRRGLDICLSRSTMWPGE